MSAGTPFKTPLPFRTPKSGHEEYYTPHRIKSDSEESTTSNSDIIAGSTTSSNAEISIVAQYDDLIRIYKQIRSDKLTTEGSFYDFVEQIKKLNSEYHVAVEECRRIQGVLDVKIHECSDLDHKLNKARKLIDQEKVNTRNMRKERDDLSQQICQVKQLLLQDKGASSRLSEEVRHKLSFLQNNNTHMEWDQNGYNPQQLSAIKEINSTGSILSDFSYSRSEDDLDGSIMQTGKGWKKHRPSTGGVAEPAVKKRCSTGHKAVEISNSDTVRATTTLTVTKDGPIMATSIIESVPKMPTAPESTNSDFYANAPPANLVFDSWAQNSPRKPDRNINTRQHSFQQKTIVMPDTCGPCEKRIRFGKTAMKCKDCKALCHVECKDRLPLPCIPLVNTPNQRNALGVIGDYTPTTPPMVPAILIHCINEIELRGLNEIGIYRVPGAERDVKALKERFLKGRGSPCLNQTDIHVICGTVKDFLRSLNEPIVTYGLWRDFVQAVEARDRADVLPTLYQVISELPQPNRDTLAYMILHLKRVAQAKDCKMNSSNLAKVFGPTIVGYSSDDPEPGNLLTEMVQHNNVMEHLINIPSDYWSAFVDVETYQPSRMQQTPSTDSLLRPTVTKGLFTPNRNVIKRKQKYFASPKH